ncbi:hypothetical protein BGX21_003404 [Mortierella sp. AD011]|nr:hypothetical protein BGX20_005903 [Mortierella sp. AD010]KAF9400840.1 hypothetical protein BGX21_003404 [Mortierella sp. AD011]
MTNKITSAPVRRPQRALSMAAETRKARDTFYVSDYPYDHPIPSSTFVNSHTQPTFSSLHPSPDAYDLQQFTQFQRMAPLPPASQSKEAAKVSQRQRREQIVLMLQQQQIEAQEKARLAKLEKQQSKIDRKQKKTESKHLSRVQSKDRQPQQQHHPLPIHPFSSEPIDLFSTGIHNDSILYHNQQPNHDIFAPSSPPTSSCSSNNNSERMRSLSLKSNTKSMYDLRPWSGGLQSPTFEYGYESDENSSAKSRNWDSLMETLYSPTTSAPSDTVSWDSKDDYDLDVVDSMTSLSLSQENNGNGNGKYLLVMGANGRTGIELVKQGLARNYRVTAFVRDDKLLLEDSSLRKNQNLLIVRGSPTSQSDVDRCVEGQDVVVNVIGARLMANDTTIGSHSQVILNNALKKHGVRRMIVVTSYGCLGLRNYLISTKKLFSRVFMTGILKDKVLQEDIIQRDSSSLDWTIVRPITLKDGELTGKYLLCSDELPKTSKIKVLARKDLAHYILSIINKPSEYGAIRSIAGRSKSSTL